VTVTSALTITTVALSNGVLGGAYSSTVAASGGAAPYAWSATGLPSALTINSLTGAISGTPASAGTFQVTVTVTDASSPMQTASHQFSLAISTSLSITTTSPLPSGQSGVAYSAALTATGGTTPLTWSATGLPNPLAINSSTGEISGTPTGPGNFTVVVTVTDSSTPTQVAKQTFSLAIATAKLVITSTSLPNGQVGTAYATTIVHSGGTAPFNWSATTGLPSGLTIGATTGQITGTPAVGGTFNVNLNVTDSSNPQQTASTSLSLSIQGLVITSTSPLPSGTAGVAYSFAFAATGGSGQLTWTISGLASRTGLTLSTAGLLSGIPTNPGTYSPTVTVTDANNVQASATFSLTIKPALLTVTTTALPIAVVNTAYQTTSSAPVQLTATGGTLPYSWAVSASTPLPAGLSLNASTGVISGTPTALGTTNVTFILTDSGSQTATATLQLTVSSIAGGGTVSVCSSVTTNPITFAPVCNGSNLSVGVNMEVPVTILFNPPLAIGVNPGVTITSGDSTQVLLGSLGLVGSGSITSSIPAGTSTITTYAQASGSVGSVINITASLPGYSSGLGTVTIANTGFVLSGPGETGGTIATFEGQTTGLTVTPYQLDSNNNPIQNANEEVRPGVTIDVPVSSSATGVGTVSTSTVAITGPAFSGSVNFVANTSNTGTATVTAGPLAGYATPATGSSVTFNVAPTNLVVPSPTIGNNLQAGMTISRNGDLTAATQVTITSSNPSLLLFSTTPTGNAAGGTCGTAACYVITLTIPANQSVTPQFYAHAYGSSGTAPYTASATGYGTQDGSVTLAPSGLIIESPFGPDTAFQMTLGSAPATLVVNTAWFSGTTPATTQAVAYGVTISATVASGNTAVGTITGSPVTFTAGQGADSSTSASFQAAGLGITSVTASASGYLSASVGVTVNALSLVVSNASGGVVGQNLEATGTVIIPGAAPSSNVQIQLKSNNPATLQLSPDNVHWSSTITVTVTAGTTSAVYYIEAMASSGQGSYTASTPSYGPATDTITMVPSGVVILSTTDTSGFSVSLAGGPKQFLVYTAQLNSAGVPQNPQNLALASLTVTFSNTAPTVGTAAPVTITAGTNGTMGTFTPSSKGSTTVTVIQPSGGWTVPSEYTTLSVTVNP
jgi:hypothetical protein